MSWLAFRVTLITALLSQFGNIPTAIAETESARTLIVKFEDISGKWTGHANEHGVTLDIEATGKFSAQAGIKGESGNARIENGTLVVPLQNYKVTLHLKLSGDTLNSTEVLEGKTWRISLKRANGPIAPNGSSPR